MYCVYVIFRSLSLPFCFIRTNDAIENADKIIESGGLLVNQSPTEREKAVDFCMAVVSHNSCQPLMEAVEKHSPDFVEWGMERLEEATPVSTDFDRNNILGEDHLFGNTPEKVAQGKSKAR